MRKAIPKKIRFEVFKRDGFLCAYCGESPPKVVLQVDHIDPVSKGGTNDIDNLVTSCQPCNIGKGATSLLKVPQSLSDKAKLIAEQEEQIKCYQEIIAKKQARIEDEALQIVDIFCSDGFFDNKDFLTIKRFIGYLGFFEVKDSAEIAKYKFLHSTSRAFKYFCGICLNKYRESQT
jgi:hypothetical protein